MVNEEVRDGKSWNWRIREIKRKCVDGRIEDNDPLNWTLGIL